LKTGIRETPVHVEKNRDSDALLFQRAVKPDTFMLSFAFRSKIPENLTASLLSQGLKANYQVRKIVCYKSQQALLPKPRRLILQKSSALS